MRLLVVDDEAVVRDLVVRHATARGWTVMAVTEGGAALAALERAGAPFDAVVCDLRMPGVSGIELYDLLSQRAPDLLRRFVFITGDLASPEAAAFAARCGCPVLEKPFELGRLLRLLERVAVAA